MISVIEVYRNLRDYCNKDQKGFVTPSVFNSFAGLAQQEIYNAIFSALPAAFTARRKNIDPGRDKSAYKQLQEDLAYYLDKEDIRSSGSAGLGLSFKKPIDLSKIVSMSLDDDTRTSVEILYDAEKADRILNSNLSTPTNEFPVALVSDDIEIFPDTVGTILLSYYRQPRSTYATSIGNEYALGDIDKGSTPEYVVFGNEIASSDLFMPDVRNCRNFDLPEHYKNQLVLSMAKYVGVSLRDEFLLTKTA